MRCRKHHTRLELTVVKHQKNKSCLRSAVTLLEMVIAVAIVTIVFAAVLPLFRTIQNSWDSKQGSAETVQNGRVLMEHMNRNLSKAVRISAVSDFSETNGYIEFEDNDANTWRYDIDSSYVQFGSVDTGDFYDLAGPVSSLQFACYDACDIDTVLSPVSDPNLIRLVKMDAVVTNSAAQGSDKTFSSYVYLRTNGSGGSTGLSKGAAFEFDILNGETPALIQIDSTHYLCAYGGPGNNGWAVVLTVDTASGTISAGTAFEYDADNGEQPALARIDDTHYLCAYRGPQTGGNKYGRAVVLTVNTGNWTISKGAAFNFEDNGCEYPALAGIDSTHYLCTYTGKNSDGWAVVLTVNPDTGAINKETAFEFDTQDGHFPALAQIDTTHFLCAYTGSISRGLAVVLTVDTGTWNITKQTPFEFDSGVGQTPDLYQVDATHYLCAYDGPGDDGWAVVLTVDTGTWEITKQTPFEYDGVKSLTPALEWIDGNRYLCIYEGASADGYANILTVDTTNWTIAAGTALEYAPTDGTEPAVWKVDDSHYLCGYSSSGNDGWAVVLGITGGLRP